MISVISFRIPLGPWPFPVGTRVIARGRPEWGVGELVTVKNYTFKVAYIGESTLLLEPHGPVLVGTEK